MNKPQTLSAVLSPQAYEKFAAQFKPLHVTETTSVLQAGKQLGVEAVLRAVREQLVSGYAPSSIQ
jgi:hypothetical protein